MIGPTPLCYGCKHFDRTGSGWKCKAFPDGIPVEIVAWMHDHRKAYKGDNGIRFEADPAHIDQIKPVLDMIDRA